MLQPAALTAADQVGTDDTPPRLRKRSGEIVEIAPLSAQSMHAHDRYGVLGRTPIHIGDGMKAG